VAEPGDATAARASPALAELAASLREDATLRVLDLGPAVRENLEHFSRFGGGVRIAHLLRSRDIETIRAFDAAAFRKTLERRVPATGEPYDLILVWDLFNYLGDDLAVLLTQHLAGVSRGGALLYAMTYTADTMPSSPSVFRVCAGNSLIYRPTTDRFEEASNPPPALVERWLKPFRVIRSFILRHGVREFLAILD